MAMVTKKAIVWQAPGTEDRIEIGLEAVVPDVVPQAIVKEWEKEDWVYEDPTKAHIALPEGPPRMTMPLTKVQQTEDRKHAMGTPVLGKTIPPRPTV